MAAWFYTLELQVELNLTKCFSLTSTYHAFWHLGFHFGHLLQAILSGFPSYASGKDTHGTDFMESCSGSKEF
jgi:hypothetical protein